jgi:transcriptional regulator with GAF, ATPase, and Fis domain
MGKPSGMKEPESVAILKQTIERLESLGRISQIVASTRDLQEALRALVDECLALTGASDGAIFLHDSFDETKTLVRRAARKQSLEVQRIGRLLAGRIFTTKEAFLSEEIGRDPRFQALDPAPQTMRSVIAVPVVTGGQIIGSLSLMRSRKMPPFTRRDLEAVEIAASQSAPLLEKARLCDELRRDVIRLQKAVSGTTSFHGIVGQSESMRRVFILIEKAAESSVAVILVGESGTGKELVAKALHELSPRRDKPFEIVTCSEFPPQLAEDQLFGHLPGSFTSASKGRLGLIPAADGGTVLLDEAQDLSQDIQMKLLRIIDTGEFRRVGEDIMRKVDVRIVAAFQADPRELVTKNRLRQDLYYRLAGLEIPLPPLRERAGDIPLLGNTFLDREAASSNKRAEKFSREAMLALESFPWPGNVRQLEQVIRGAVALLPRDAAIVTPEYLPGYIPHERLVSAASTPSSKQQGGASFCLTDYVRDIEKHMILGALHDSQGNQSEAARRLGLPLGTLRDKMRRYAIGCDQ